MHVHAQFDRFDFARSRLGNGSDGGLRLRCSPFFVYFLFASCNHRASGVADFPSPDDPMLTFTADFFCPFSWGEGRDEGEQLLWGKLSSVQKSCFFIKSVFSLFLSFSLSFLSLTNGIVSSGGAPVA
jgi:hypothetical protein